MFGIASKAKQGINLATGMAITEGEDPLRTANAATKLKKDVNRCEAFYDEGVFKFKSGIWKKLATRSRLDQTIRKADLWKIYQEILNTADPSQQISNAKNRAKTVGTVVIAAASRAASEAVSEAAAGIDTISKTVRSVFYPAAPPPAAPPPAAPPPPAVSISNGPVHLGTLNKFVSAPPTHSSYGRPLTKVKEGTRGSNPFSKGGKRTKKQRNQRNKNRQNKRKTHKKY